jgi:hypothetical protein
MHVTSALTLGSGDAMHGRTGARAEGQLRLQAAPHTACTISETAGAAPGAAAALVKLLRLRP